MASEAIHPSSQLILRRTPGRPKGAALIDPERVHVRAEGARTRARN